MSVEIVDRQTMPCGVCHAQVTELRRGRCWGCYARWGEARPVGIGAACSVCGERRRTELRMVELHARSHAVCHSCSGKIARLSAIPNTLAGIRGALNRERRTLERRADEADRRIFPRERRVGERRTPPRAVEPGEEITNPAFRLAEVEEMVIELDEADIEADREAGIRDDLAAGLQPGEETRVHE